MASRPDSLNLAAQLCFDKFQAQVPPSGLLEISFPLKAAERAIGSDRRAGKRGLTTWSLGAKPEPRQVIVTMDYPMPVHLTKVASSRDDVKVETKAVEEGKSYMITLTPQSTDRRQLGMLTLETDCAIPRHQKKLVFFSFGAPPDAGQLPGGPTQAPQQQQADVISLQPNNAVSAESLGLPDALGDDFESQFPKRPQVRGTPVVFRIATGDGHNPNAMLHCDFSRSASARRITEDFSDRAGPSGEIIGTFGPAPAPLRDGGGRTAQIMVKIADVGG